MILIILIWKATKLKVRYDHTDGSCIESKGASRMQNDAAAAGVSGSECVSV
jgi:hypothetical protein